MICIAMCKVTHILKELFKGKFGTLVTLFPISTEVLYVQAVIIVAVLCWAAVNPVSNLACLYPWTLF
jgi:hypothetical protein